MAEVSGANWRGGITTIEHDEPIDAEPGDSVAVEGVTPSGYDGTYEVVACTATACTVAMADPGAYESGGTITKEN